MLNISVGGDAEGGYLVDIHDGTKHGVYRPESTDDHGAFVAAIRDHDPELAAALGDALGSAAASKSLAAMRAQLKEASDHLVSVSAEREAAKGQVLVLQNEIVKLKIPPPANDTKA